VFPEYGILGFDHSRDSIVPFLEDVPDVSDEWTPCDNPDRFKNISVLQHLSCSAKQSNIYIVANIGDIKKCDIIQDLDCPIDGRYQFNTNVVFNNEGMLVARYHKKNLYDESEIFDPSPTVEYSFIETPFGTFGTVICFDLLHYYPTQDLILSYGVKNLLVTSAWNVFYPFVFPIQMYAGLAKRNNINVIASNIRHTEYEMASSGIFGPGVEMSTDTDFTRTYGHLLVTEIETVLKSTKHINSLKALPSIDLIRSMTNTTYTGIYPHFGMNMSFVELSEEGFVSVCSEGNICCALEYEFSRKDETETAVLSVVDFKIEYPGRVHMQYCAVHLCPSTDLGRCGEPAFNSTSVISRLKLQGYFSGVTNAMFPFVSSTPFRNHTYYSERENYRFDDSQAILTGGPFKYQLFNAVIFNSVPESYVEFAPVSGSISTIFISSVTVLLFLCTVSLFTC